jgi:hypothetical protein
MENLVYELFRISEDKKLDGIFPRIQLKTCSTKGEPSEINPYEHPDPYNKWSMRVMRLKNRGALMSGWNFA